MMTFYAIQNVDGKRHFFEWAGNDTFASREELADGSGEWTKRVTPNMAARTVFDVHEEAGN